MALQLVVVLEDGVGMVQLVVVVERRLLEEVGIGGGVEGKGDAGIDGSAMGKV